MTYEQLINMKEICEQMARQTIDEKLRKFYANAAKGFEIKALRRTLGEETNNEAV